MLGALFALLSAAAFGLNNAYARRGMISASVLQAMIITVPIGVPLVLLLAILFGQMGGLVELPFWAVFWFALAGVVHMVWGRYCNYRATSAVGANLTGPFMQGELIISLMLAIWILNEYLTPLRLIGIILIFLAPMLLVEHKSKTTSAKNSSAGAADAKAVDADAGVPKWQPRYAEGFFFASLAAVAYGMSNILVRIGLLAAHDAGVTNISLIAILISYVAAAVVVIAIILAFGQTRHALSTPPGPAKSFVLAGIIVSFSQMFRYVALSIAPVTVVAPILRLGSVFKVLFSTIINREHEVFNGRVILVTTISLLGALCLSLSVDIVIDVVPMPDWLVAIARSRWP